MATAEFSIFAGILSAALSQHHLLGFEIAQLEFHTEELYKKDLHNPDNHDGVNTYLESDILESEVKWSLESITTNKASGGGGIPVELFQVLKDGLYSLWNSPGQNTGVGSLSLLQGTFQPRNQTQVSHIAGGFFTSWARRKAQEYWSG